MFSGSRKNMVMDEIFYHKVWLKAVYFNMLVAIFYSFFLGNVWEIWLSDLFIAHWINIEEKINSLKNKEELLQRARSGKSLMTWHLIGQPINSSKLEMKVPVFEDKRHIWVIDEKSKTDILWICIMIYSNHTDTTSTETKDGCHHMIFFSHLPVFCHQMKTKNLLFMYLVFYLYVQSIHVGSGDP